MKRSSFRRPTIKTRLPWQLLVLLLIGAIILAVTIDLYFGRGWSFWQTFPVEWDHFNWQAAATVFVGLVAIITLYANRELQDRQFNIKALSDEFTDILNRLADKDNPLIRANAANRLADMAERRLPGKPVKHLPENYPFYIRVASQLADTLILEADNVVRATVVRALRRMTDFAARGDQLLLYGQIDELLRVNRNAKEVVASTLGSYIALVSGGQEIPDNVLQQLSNVVSFQGVSQTQDPTLASLCGLSCTSWFLKAVTVGWLLNEAGAQRDEEDNYKLVLTKLKTSSLQLQDTASALSTCLRALAPTSYQSYEPSGQVASATASLAGCFLVGCDLQGSHLEGVYLQEGLLCGANLESAHLRNSNLEGAHMEWCNLAGADVSNAQIMNAKIFKLQVEDIQQSIGKKVNFSGTNWQQADLGAPKKWDIRGATQTNIWPKGKDESLEEWLHANFP